MNERNKCFKERLNERSDEIKKLRRKIDGIKTVKEKIELILNDIYRRVLKNNAYYRGGEDSIRIISLEDLKYMDSVVYEKDYMEKVKKACMLSGIEFSVSGKNVTLMYLDSEKLKAEDKLIQIAADIIPDKIEASTELKKVCCENPYRQIILDMIMMLDVCNINEEKII